MTKKTKNLLPAISLLCLLSLLATALHAQEAPDENIPGMRTKRDVPLPPLSPSSKELSPQEREGLNNLFKGELEGEKKPEMPPTNAVPVVTPPPAPEPVIAPLQSPGLYMNTARLLKFTVLNKQTTRLYSQELTTGGSATFGPLTVKLIECWHSSPDTTPDSAALLQIIEARPDGKRKQIFLGWMFAATPSLNPLEHPAYDIAVKECR